MCVVGLITKNSTAVTFVLYQKQKMIYTYKLFKAFPPYFTGSDICYKFSFCQQSTVTEYILNLFDPSTARGEVQLYFLLILCLQIYYWQCLGFRSPPKGLLISVLSPAGLFLLFNYLYY